MDTRGIAMKKQSGFDLRKLTITIVTSVSLAVIIQAHFFSGDTSIGETSRWRPGSLDRACPAVASDGGTGVISGEVPVGEMKETSQGSIVPGDEAGEIYRENPEQLVLVNRENPLSTAYDAMLQQICGGRLQASSRLYEDLRAMLSGAERAGHSYWIASAYRSRERQQELVDEEMSALAEEGMSASGAVKEVYRETMPAGCSEHETGLALDILASENTMMDRSQEKEAGNLWLRENCQEYGFVLRYPEDKSEVTGVDYEPWHFRYVGKRAARFLKKHGLTLEEFYQCME